MTYEALGLLTDLTPADVDWIFAHGIEQQVIANSCLTIEGETPPALYLVLEGLVGIRVRGCDAPLGTLGPGQIVGEMSFLQDRPASATVQAVENSLLLALPTALLEERVAADPPFAGRLFRALARILAARLRDANVAAAARGRGGVELARLVRERWTAVDEEIECFKHTLADLDRQAAETRRPIPEPDVQAVRARFATLCESLNRALGAAPDEPEPVQHEIGMRIQRELLPFVLLTRNGERWYGKPRGYAGDFLAIEWVYENRADGVGRLGPLLDRCCLDLHAARAVRNRRALLADEITRTLAECGGRPAHVLTMACGPAREIFDVFETLDDPARLVANCLDIDLQALAHVDALRDERGLKRHVHLQNANLVYLATGRQKLDLPPQDLAYSIGLIDYFNDTFVVRLLDYVHSLLRPGGRVILGNFHPRNPSKAFMDHVLDWKLIHRDEEDMNRLFRESRFGVPCDEIRFEEQGINLFAMARRR